MTPSRQRRSRCGVAAVWALVVLAVVATVSAALVGRFAATRRQVDAYRNRTQAEALARAGYELAVARLLTKPDDLAETATPIPGGEVKVVAKKDAGGVYRVASVARYAPDGAPAVALTVSRAVKRVESPDGVRVEAVPDKP